MDPEQTTRLPLGNDWTGQICVTLRGQTVQHEAKSEKVETDTNQLKECSPEVQGAAKLNPWPFLWAAVGAWIWYGALRLVQ